MTKNTILALVIGLIIGGLAVWLIFGFTDAGTLLVRYNSQSEKSQSSQNLISEDKEPEVDLSSPDGGQAGITELLQQAEPWNPGMCDPEFDRNQYNVSGDLTNVEQISNFPDIRFRLTWNTHLDIPLNCIEGGSRLNVKWYDLRSNSNNFPWNPSSPSIWYTNELFHEETIDLPDDRQTMSLRTTFNGFQQEMPGNKYGVYNVFTLIEPDGTVRELDHFYAKSEPMVPQNPLVNPWHWVESQAGTFN